MCHCSGLEWAFSPAQSSCSHPGVSYSGCVHYPGQLKRGDAAKLQPPLPPAPFGCGPSTEVFWCKPRTQKPGVAWVKRVCQAGSIEYWAEPPVSQTMPFPRGGRPLGSGRQLPPLLTVGRRPLGGGASEGGVQGGRRGGGGGGGIGGAGGGGALGGSVGGGSKWGNSGWWGGGVQVGRFGVLGGGGGHRLPLPPLALPLTIPSP